MFESNTALIAMPHLFDLGNDIFHCQVVRLYGYIETSCLKHYQEHFDFHFKVSEVSCRDLVDYFVNALYSSLFRVSVIVDIDV